MKITAVTAAIALSLTAFAAGAAAPAKIAKKPAAPAYAAADQAQMEAAGRALTGPYECEFNQSITVEPNAAAPGYIDVKFRKAVYTMKPIQSSTGALRLEESLKGGKPGKRLWLQIANKSMLMDGGQRIVDGCTHASQRQATAN